MQNLPLLQDQCIVNLAHNGSVPIGAMPAQDLLTMAVDLGNQSVISIGDHSAHLQ